MKERKTLKPNRIVSGLMSLVMIVMIFSALFFIAEEAGHHCTGEDCHICKTAEQCRNAVRRVGEVIFGAVHAILFIITAVTACIEVNETFLNNSLVSQKVRMND